MEKEILAAYEGMWAASEAVETESQLLLAPRLPVFHRMLKGEMPLTHHVASATWSKWTALLTQWVQRCPGLIEELMEWPKKL